MRLPTFARDRKQAPLINSPVALRGNPGPNKLPANARHRYLIYTGCILPGESFDSASAPRFQGLFSLRSERSFA